MSSTSVQIEITVNGRLYHETVKSDQTLLHLIREQLNLTGTKEGCSNGQCGACTVIKDGKSVNACITLAVQCHRSEILTIEGLADSNQLHPIQQAFVDEGAIQCGFCTPGMVMSAKALLDHDHNPSEDGIKDALAGNLCRCTGYVKIVKAVKKAAEVMREGDSDGSS